MDEANLVSLLKRKDPKAFELLYDNYSGALYGVILKVLHNKALSEDILQDVFVKIWNNIEQYNTTKGKLYTWIINIARNTAIDKLRSKSYKQEEVNRGIDDTPTLHDHGSFSTKQSTDAIGLGRWVERLKEEHKIIIDLIYFKGYTQSEVAKELEIPLGTVKTRVRSALNHLKELIR
ncbi:MAG: RNA polymerase sigma factor [Thermonemataceae bacterium]